MTALPTHLTIGFDLLLRSTLQAGILILLILGLRRLFARRLPGQWLYALWAVLLIRLALPWAPESNLSLYRILPEFNSHSRAGNSATPVSLSGFAPDLMTDGPPADPPTSTITPASRATAAGTDAVLKPKFDFAAAWRSWDSRQIACLTWVTGLLVLGTSLVAGNLTFLRRVRREPLIIDQGILRLLEQCKSQMKVRTVLTLVASDAVNSPALCGFIRPRLLLPREMIRTLSPSELRHIFLHELAHLKRHDVLVSWMMSFLQVLHWFNPLVWIALHRMRADRELACDSLALAALGSDTPRDYGRTLLHVFESFRKRQYLPALAGLMDNPSQLQRRIAMIAHPHRGSRASALLGLSLVVGLGPVALTDSPRATAAGAKDDQKAKPALATSSPCNDPQEEATLPEGSTIDSRGRIVDKIDRPFVDDPQAIGKWESVDFVKKMEDFDPKKPHTKAENLFMKGLVLSKGGGASWPWMGWTKGFVMHDGDKTASGYVIKEIDGSTYMFYEWKSGDYTIRHRKPMFGVLKKLPADSTKFEHASELFAPKPGEAKVELGPDSRINEHGVIVDKIDYPFVTDPQVIGQWESVDYVKKIEYFDPKKTQKPLDRLFLRGLVFSEDGIANFGMRWTKGLVLHEGDHTASKYVIKDIGGVTYMFYEWKSGDYTMAHRKPDFYVLKKLPAGSTRFNNMRDLYDVERSGPKAELGPDSKIDKNGVVIDKTDYPFVDDPQIVGQWKSVDFVDDMSRFSPDSPRWKGDLFLKEMIFLPKGRTFRPWYTWTKGLIFHSGDHTASKYTIREIDGVTYMFFEWKSGDYTFRQRKPAYYVLKKVSSDTGSLGKSWSKQPSDQEFNRTLQAKVAGFNIDAATPQDVIRVFGEPGQYMSKADTLDSKNLPESYSMQYPAAFSVHVTKGRVQELRFASPGYRFEGKIQVGSSKEDAMKLLEPPLRTVKGGKLTFEDRVLYEDIGGRPAYGYYGNQARHVRIGFNSDQVATILVTRSDAKPWEK